MATLAGKVKMLRETGQITHVDAQLGATTTALANINWTGEYTAIFDIEGRTINLTRYSPIVIILDGDEVVVGGSIKDDGIFYATAFENITRGIRSNSAIGSYMPLVTSACFAGVAFFWFVALVLIRGEDFFFWIACAMTGLLIGLDWWARSYNRRMMNDAYEVGEYAKSLMKGSPN